MEVGTVSFERGKGSLERIWKAKCFADFSISIIHFHLQTVREPGPGLISGKLGIWVQGQKGRKRGRKRDISHFSLRKLGYDWCVPIRRSAPPESEASARTPAVCHSSPEQNGGLANWGTRQNEARVVVENKMQIPSQEPRLVVARVEKWLLVWADSLFPLARLQPGQLRAKLPIRSSSCDRGTTCSM